MAGDLVTKIRMSLPLYEKSLLSVEVEQDTITIKYASPPVKPKENKSVTVHNTGKYYTNSSKTADKIHTGFKRHRNWTPYGIGRR
jgi:hypothetical protein